MTDGQAAERLLARLDVIRRSLAATDGAPALLRLVSVGAETDRLDAHSDLDFFAIVEDGTKQRSIADLASSPSSSPTSCPGIPFAPGRVVWAAEGFDTRVLERSAPAPTSPGGVDVAFHGWLSGVAPLRYAFRNTADGYKRLCADDAAAPPVGARSTSTRSCTSAATSSNAHSRAPSTGEDWPPATTRDRLPRRRRPGRHHQPATHLGDTLCGVVSACPL